MPIEGARRIAAENRVVILEGAYMWHSLGEWVDIRRMLNGLLYVDEGESIMSAQVRPSVGVGVGFA